MTNRYHYQDASGSTSHVASNTGALLEWYRYDLQGTPVFYNASNTQISASGYGIRHLFTGQQWYSEIGLYDLRNRFYSPDIGRFLQTDPIDFDRDSTNLYRYCGNNPLTNADPFGLWTIQIGISFTAQIGPGSFSVGEEGSGVATIDATPFLTFTGNPKLGFILRSPIPRSA
jgi:RHS repeat-associated protein